MQRPTVGRLLALDDAYHSMLFSTVVKKSIVRSEGQTLMLNVRLYMSQLLASDCERRFFNDLLAVYGISKSVKTQ